MVFPPSIFFVLCRLFSRFFLFRIFNSYRHHLNSGLFSTRAGERETRRFPLKISHIRQTDWLTAGPSMTEDVRRLLAWTMILFTSLSLVMRSRRRGKERISNISFSRCILIFLSQSFFSLSLFLSLSR